MTQETFPKGRIARLIELGKISGAIASIIALMALVFGILGPARNAYNKIVEFIDKVDDLQRAVDSIQEWQLHQTEAMTTLQTNQTFILTTLDEATRPRVIFETNLGLSGPRDGYCQLGASCGIDVRIRRTREGLPCDVIPGVEKFYMISSETGDRVQVFRSSGTPITDVGRDWFDYHWTFEMPTLITEPSAFLYEFAYQHCRGQDDTAIITQESAIIPVPILTPEEAAELSDNPTDEEIKTIGAQTP